MENEKKRKIATNVVVQEESHKKTEQIHGNSSMILMCTSHPFLWVNPNERNQNALDFVESKNLLGYKKIGVRNRISSLFEVFSTLAVIYLQSQILLMFRFKSIFNITSWLKISDFIKMK